MEWFLLTAVAVSSKDDCLGALGELVFLLLGVAGSERSEVAVAVFGSADFHDVLSGKYMTT